MKIGSRARRCLQPEGPQAGRLAEDIAVALDAEPEARRAFDSLATFYRKGWLRWIEATKRRWAAIRAAKEAGKPAVAKTAGRKKGAA